MNLDAYRQFTQSLTERCKKDGRIIGLIALGSMADQDYAPDQWSDHDFFLITQPGQQQSVKNDLSWLPNAENVIFLHQETHFGLRAFYHHGHLIELAIFDLNELSVARANRYRVLVDKGQVEAAIKTVVTTTEEIANKQADNIDEAFAHFLSNIWVGYGRYQRGEKLSGHEFVKNHALINLIKLIQHYSPADNHAQLDNLNPLRRFEQCYPELGQELMDAMAHSFDQTCLQFLGISERELHDRIPNFPSKLYQVLYAYLT
ncbi:MAG: hypothetical protein AAF490_14480 [Chloroflexota bacterium]